MTIITMKLVEEYQPLGRAKAAAKPQHINFFEELEHGDKVSADLGAPHCSY